MGPNGPWCVLAAPETMIAGTFGPCSAATTAHDHGDRGLLGEDVGLAEQAGGRVDDQGQGEGGVLAD